MYQINDIIVYKNSGLYQISDIGIPDFVTTGRSYYTMQSLYEESGTVYVNLDHEYKMRPILSKKAAEECLALIPDIEGRYDTNIKTREKEYAEILNTGDYTKWLELLKGILLEKCKRNRVGKHLCVKDDNYLQKVEKLLTHELSLAMDIPLSELKYKIEKLI